MLYFNNGIIDDEFDDLSKIDMYIDEDNINLLINQGIRDGISFLSWIESVIKEIKKSENIIKESDVRKNIIVKRDIGFGEICYKCGGGSNSDSIFESHFKIYDNNDNLILLFRCGNFEKLYGGKYRTKGTYFRCIDLSKIDFVKFKSFIYDNFDINKLIFGEVKDIVFAMSSYCYLKKISYKEFVEKYPTSFYYIKKHFDISSKYLSKLLKKNMFQLNKINQNSSKSKLVEKRINILNDEINVINFILKESA